MSNDITVVLSAFYQSPCCQKVYKCRICHDDKEAHEINRHAVMEVECLKCSQRQPVSYFSRLCVCVGGGIKHHEHSMHFPIRGSPAWITFCFNTQVAICGQTSHFAHVPDPCFFVLPAMPGCRPGWILRNL